MILISYMTSKNFDFRFPDSMKRFRVTSSRYSTALNFLKKCSVMSCKYTYGGFYVL